MPEAGPSAIGRSDDSPDKANGSQEKAMDAAPFWG